MLSIMGVWNGKRIFQFPDPLTGRLEEFISNSSIGYATRLLNLKTQPPDH